eukprot:evm.model.scf_1199.1 EVM.evm.TU.scf_1199.1   scf_1199:29360-36037(+)
MDHDAKIEQFLILAKGAHGRAVADLIEKATAEPGLFAFGELLDLPSVKQIKGTGMDKWHKMLELFAYGTWADYKGHRSGFPKFTDKHVLKLKQLTIVSLAAKHKVLPYSELMQELEIPNVRQLEDLLITDCFYQDLINGKLDQSKRCLIVNSGVSRDVKREDVQGLMGQLASWLHRSEAILVAIEEKVTFTHAAAEASQKRKEDVDKEADRMLKTLKEQERFYGPQMTDSANDLMEEDRISRSKRESMLPYPISYD